MRRRFLETNKRIATSVIITEVGRHRIRTRGSFRSPNKE